MFVCLPLTLYLCYRLPEKVCSIGWAKRKDQPPSFWWWRPDEEVILYISHFVHTYSRQPMWMKWLNERNIWRNYCEMKHSFAALCYQHTSFTVDTECRRTTWPDWISISVFMDTTIVHRLLQVSHDEFTELHARKLNPQGFWFTIYLLLDINPLRALLV